jgi:hypothetical protein
MENDLPKSKNENLLPVDDCLSSHPIRSGIPRSAKNSPKPRSHEPPAMKTFIRSILLPAILALSTHAAPQVPDPATMPEIKAYCLDFNWQGSGRRKKIASPGFMKDADPRAVVDWHKAIGSNVIQTFCVAHNGYAYYRSEVTPEQPGLKHDFLRETVKLGHAEGMVVMGYFSIAANKRWAAENPELSYDTADNYHIPYTDGYLAYLTAAIADAVKTANIDGFMIDWIWQPSRKAGGGKWIEAEKKLYQQLMGEPFPGEDKLTPQQDLEYSRKALDRCWKTIRKAAKDANPNCIVWLTCNQIKHPHIVNSDMFREVDWLMAETGDNKALKEIRGMVGPHTRLITCLAAWNNADPSVVIPEAMEHGIGLYGFCAPGASNGTIPLDRIFPHQLSMLTGDQRNIGALARAYLGKSLDAVWNGSAFEEPENPPAFRLRFPGRGRGVPDTGGLAVTAGSTIATLRSPYHAGQVTLIRTRPEWPATVIRLEHKPDQSAQSTAIRITNGSLACEFLLESNAAITWGGTKDLQTGRGWKFTPADGSDTPQPRQATVTKTPAFIEFAVPTAFFQSNPESIAIEWLK